MRRHTRVAVTMCVGITLTIGALASIAAAGANVAIADGPLLANPAFVANTIDATNPASGATGSVHLVVNGGLDGKSIVALHVAGLPADRSFAAHLHRDSCASAFGGPHYQAPDPAAPVVANADADHEVWLDFSTNESGRGSSDAQVAFQVLSGYRSVIVHQGDHTLPGGTAGQRLACLDLTV
jgi:Cu-Zn family superoxide dismutase